MPDRFTPNPRQRRFRRYLLAHPEINSIQRTCAGARVARSSFYNWRKNPEFGAWLYAGWTAAAGLDSSLQPPDEQNQQLALENWRISQPAELSN
ncbi:MAG TPA: hypothetical protein VFP94_02275 [Terriglobales bacterium]|nr:hypothetical protein [Terriglobales bacterium]